MVLNTAELRRGVVLRVVVKKQVSQWMGKVQIEAEVEVDAERMVNGRKINWS